MRTAYRQYGKLPIDNLSQSPETKNSMKKKTAHRRAHKASPAKAARPVKRNDDGQYILVVHGWIFLVAFALMLGMGVIVGNYINAQLNGGVPTVAGAQIEAR